MKKGTIAVLSTIFGATVGVTANSFIAAKETGKKAEKIDKFKQYYSILNKWLVLKQEGKCLSGYFIKNNYHTIAIYGMGEMGNRLLEELKNSEIEVAYAIDKDARSTYADVDVIAPEENFADVDVIVVSATFAYDAIVEQLKAKTDSPIISLEEVVYSL